MKLVIAIVVGWMLLSAIGLVVRVLTGGSVDR